MKYIVITTKHHDGFAMFKSAASPFNIVDATPFGRDPLKELAAACAKHGIRLGFYYSQAQDWHRAGGGVQGAEPGRRLWRLRGPGGRHRRRRHGCAGTHGAGGQHARHLFQRQRPGSA
jgi:hypothetical protein